METVRRSSTHIASFRTEPPGSPKGAVAETRAWTELARLLAEDPHSVPQQVAAFAKELCHANAAGICLLEAAGEDRVLRCCAVDGVSRVKPGDAYPYKGRLDDSHLAAELDHFFPYLSRIRADILKRICTPVLVDGEPAGVLWVLGYCPGLAFDDADKQIVRSLGHFASAALRLGAGQFQDKQAASYREREQHARASEIERETVRQLVNAQEAERERISRELHDGLGQRLTLLSLKLAALKKQIPGGAAAALELENIQRFVKVIDDDLDFVVWELRPTALDDLGLVEALNEHVDSYSQHWGMDVSVRALGEQQPRLNLEIETVCYRVVQEALTNVVKHAAAGHVDIVLERHNGNVKLTITDDGVGLPEAGPQGSTPRGFGLIGIKERAALVGGIVSIAAAPGRGTKVALFVPGAALAATVRPLGGLPAMNAAIGKRSPVRVLLADNHAMLLEGLALVINSEPDMQVVAKAADGREAVDTAAKARPDVAVLDVSMPGLDGIEATALLRATCPSVRVLALTRHREYGYFRRMLDAGASGFVLKKNAANELIKAIRAVASGETYIESEMAATHVERTCGNGSAHRHAGGQVLSAREEQMLRMTAWGLGNKEIAGKLGLSIKTVESYKSTAMAKYRLSSRSEVVRHAIACGWLADDAPN